MIAPLILTTALVPGSMGSVLGLPILGIRPTTAAPFSSHLSKYEVLIGQTGLSPTAEWGVTLNGTYEFGSGSDSLPFIVMNGSLPYYVSRIPTGFAATPPNGTMDVDGARVNFTVTFDPTPSRAGSNSSANILGLPPAEGYAAIGAIIAIAVAGTVLAWSFDRRARGPPR
ncbi:MAG: hypothetical protein L3K10_03690 [Thermoplasmata archaeon]|nr:hypothetical protein [Thermoplasmata archaeon]